MRKIIAILLLASCTMACRHANQLSDSEIKEHLQKTMTDFLSEKHKNDTPAVKFNILDVTYFADEAYYECRFKVNMHQRNTDTVGIMSANISKDFTQVGRRY